MRARWPPRPPLRKRPASALQPRRRSRSRSSTSSPGKPSLKAFDDPDIADGAVAERAQRFSVARAVVARNRLVETGKFGDHEALVQPGLESRARVAAAEVAHAERRKCNRRKLGIGGKLRRILDLAIGSHPVGLWHWSAPRNVSVCTILARA